MRTEISLDRNDIVYAIAAYVLKHRNVNVKEVHFNYSDKEHNHCDLPDINADVTVYDS